jgi:hypothetical protein
MDHAVGKSDSTSEAPLVKTVELGHWDSTTMYYLNILKLKAVTTKETQEILGRKEKKKNLLEDAKVKGLSTMGVLCTVQVRQWENHSLCHLFEWHLLGRWSSALPTQPYAAALLEHLIEPCFLNYLKDQDFSIIVI